MKSTHQYRRKKTIELVLPNKTYLKMRIKPTIYTSSGCVWIVSLAVARSKRQINDWFNKRKRKAACRLNYRLTGTFGFLVQGLAVRYLRQWAIELPPGDSISFCCESALPEKQFRIWQRWFQLHEDPAWQISKEYKSFFFYKSKGIK